VTAAHYLSAAGILTGTAAGTALADWHKLAVILALLAAAATLSALREMLHQETRS